MPEPSSFIDRWLLRLGILDAAEPLQVNLRVLRLVATFHLLALLACVPWLFSWSGLAWAVGGLYLFGTLGISIGFHRLLTHRGFACPLWLEHGLSVLGVCCCQGGPISWVVVHRMHHQHSDQTTDPHCPRASFFWSHIGWLLVHNPALYSLAIYDRYARTLLRNRFYRWLERPQVWQTIHYAQWAAFLLVGTVAGALAGGTAVAALQLGLSWLLWGVVVRTVVVWHITWSVNSFSHRWGYRNYDTADDSRNNWLVGLVSSGDGWHNNHHAQPRCVAHGRRWWELDLAYLTVCLWELVGLAWNLVKPNRSRALDYADEPAAAA
jgi:stearoyl-CoA desaturase (delta-9 desaturase)